MDSAARLGLRALDSAMGFVVEDYGQRCEVVVEDHGQHHGVQLGSMDRAMDSTMWWWLRPMDSTMGFQLGIMDSSVHTHFPCAQTARTPGNPSLSGAERCSLGAGQGGAHAAPGTATLSRWLWERLRLKGSAF